MPVLTAQNATIQTVSVSIKTLTLERKQVTLAVFRQLIEEHIYDFNARALRGVGWGHVRYLIDGPVDQAINLVWQRGSELRRCIVSRNIYTWHTEIAQVSRLLDRPFIVESAFVNGTYQEIWQARSINYDGNPRFRPEGVPETLLTPPTLEQISSAQTAWIIFSDSLKKEGADYRKVTAPLFDLPQLFIAV